MKYKKQKFFALILIITTTISLDLSELPSFSESLHEDPSVNYFHISLEEEPGKKNIDLVQEYADAWMKISDSEKIKIRKLRIEGAQVENRYEGKYFNKKNQISKTYYFNVNFGNGKSDSADYQGGSGASVKVGSGYQKNYRFTLDSDCDAIKKKYKVDDIKCTPLVNDKYIIESVYNVDLIKYAKNEGDNGTVEKKIIIVRSVSGQTKAKNLTVDLKDISIYKKIMSAINSTKEVPISKLNSYLNKKIIKEQVKKLVNSVDDFIKTANDESKNIKKKYQKNIRDTLWTKQNEDADEEKNLNKSHNLLNKVSDKVTAFNIEQAIKADMYLMRFKEKMLSHKAKVNYYFDELSISQAMEDLDEFEYERDKEMELNLSKIS